MINGSRLIKELIQANWNNIKAQTTEDSISFAEYKDYKRVKGYEMQKDWVLTYNREGTEDPSAIGNVGRQVIYRVPVDIRTNISDDRANALDREVRRIIRKNVNYFVPGGQTHSTIGQQVILEVRGGKPFSNTEESALHNNYRRVLEITITAPNEAVEE